MDMFQEQIKDSKEGYEHEMKRNSPEWKTEMGKNR